MKNFLHEEFNEFSLQLEKMKSTFNNKKFHKAQRERKRMHSLNEALEILRRKLQNSICDDLKLPKIETLKLGKIWVSN